MPEKVAETPLLRRLNEQRVAAAKMAQMYAARAAEGEELSAEDNGSYTRANADIDRYGKLIKDEVERIQEARDIDAAFEIGIAKLGQKPEERRAPAARRSLAEQMRADLKESMEGQSPRNGGMFQQIPETRAATPLAKGTATAGAELVPVTLVESLYEKLFDDSAVLSAGVTILRTQSGESMKLPRLTALKGTDPTQAQSLVAEAGAIYEGEPTFDQVQLDAYKYAQYSKLSRELVEDGVLDIEALVGRVLGRNIANFLGYDLTLGTGTNQPKGVRTCIPTANKVDSAAGGAFPTTDFDKFIEVMAKLKPGYRRGAKWMVNDQAMFTLRKVKMNGVYAWEPNLQGAGMPDRFLGYPVLADPNIPMPASAAGVTAIFADFSAYFVRLVRDVRVEWSTELAWVNDQLAVKAVLRGDGDAIDDAALAGFNSIT